MPTGAGLNWPVVCVPPSCSPPSRLGGGHGLRPALVRTNGNYVRSLKKCDLLLTPAKQVAVLACIDARIDVHTIAPGA